jgi:phage tail sheath protein FI
VRNNVIERYAFVSAALDAKAPQGGSNYYKQVINQSSPWVWWTGHDTSVTTADAKATVVFPNTSSNAVTESLSGGNNGTPTLTNSNRIEAYDLFLPDSEIDVSILMAGDSDAVVSSHLIQNIAEVRKDLVVTLSPERTDVVNNNAFSTAEQEDVIEFRNTLPSSSYGIMDSGWKYMYDKYNDTYRYVPLNGDIAGLMVITDSIRDPWFSPAGFNRGSIKNIVRLAFNPAKAERDQLYKNGINPVVAFPGQGTVLFGDKTLLTKPSAFDRINVRRLFIVLEKAISRAAQYSLFEFNDDFTRAQFRNLIEPFLRDVQGRRGIFDFRVVCDTTNNTPEIIDRNEFVGSIYVKPARSINFIQLNFIAVRTGVEFDEVVGSF